MALKPDIYYFNPSCEMAVANATAAFQPNSRIYLFEEALESIMHVFAQPNDVVLVRRLPDEAFLAFYRQHHMLLPTFYLLEKNDQPKAPLGQLKPWGWSPVVHRLLKPYKAVASNGAEPFVQSWRDEFRNWYSREFASDILRSMLKKNRQLPLVSDAYLPVKCTTVNQVAELLTKFGKGVVKAPWSSSGRGVQMLRRPNVTPNFKAWLSGVFQQQGFVMFEQMLEVEQHIGLQFSISDGQVNFMGYSFFYGSANGQYQGNYINLAPEDLPEETASLFTDGTYNSVIKLLISTLKSSDLAKTYTGVLGVDTLVVKLDGKWRIQPCLEINLRHTMGHVALALSKAVATRSRGKFEIWFDNKSTFRAFVKQKATAHPLKIENGKIVSGFLPLSSNWDASIGAYLLVSVSDKFRTSSEELDYCPR